MTTGKVWVCSLTFISMFFIKEMARAKGSGQEDLCSLDVHALDELKTKGFAQTDESSKYNYTKDADGNYGEYCSRSWPYELIVRSCVVN